METAPIRVRYAPSPTGFLHIGGARSALFNYLFAKHHGGTFIVRIEDTDVERNVVGGEISQINDLIWLGIVPDESPLQPNVKYLPYRQMERLSTYQQYAQQLIDQGYAYPCYCSEAELEQSREEQMQRGIVAPQYNRRCLHLTPEQKANFVKQGIQPTIRLKLEDHHQIKFNDMVRGEVTFNNDDIGDWVLVKSNGIPTYNFAVVIDDHLMDITHVLRGEEHLSNTPKQIQLYEYFKWTIPQFGHMTLIINENGKKLSKRDQNILQFISQYREQGYLPEAITNFILLLGWTPAENREIFNLQDAIQAFDEKRLSSSPSMFGVKKLTWINSTYIKTMSEESYLKFIEPYLVKSSWVVTLSEEKRRALAMIFKEQLAYGEEIVTLIDQALSEHTLLDEGIQVLK
jgi:nondiscriminating glutamyl-tRNA synthetase